MKKILCLLLVLSLVFSCGCAGLVELPKVSTEPPASTQEASTEPVTTEAPATTEVTTEPVTTEAASTEAPSTQPPATQPPATQPPATEPVNPYSYLFSRYFDQGTYTDSFGQTSTYSYELPGLNADTAGARAINEAIDEYFGKQIDNAYESMKENNSLFLYHVGFNTFLWKDILTIVMITHNDFGQDDYGVYCYEASTGKWLSTELLLDRMNINTDDFIYWARDAAGQYYEAQYPGATEDLIGSDAYQHGIAVTVDNSNINLNMMAYPDNGGKLHVIAKIGSIAGADWYYHDVPVSFPKG